MEWSRDDPRVRAYFDARAELLDRLYEPRPGLRGAFEAWVYGPLRRRLALTLAELGDLSGRRVLDIGCGPGRYAVALAERGAEVVGVDISETMLSLARGHARERGVAGACRFVRHDFAVYEPDEVFDVGLMLGVLEYLPDPRPSLARLHDMTTGKVILSVPPPFRWQTIVRRVRHRLRPGPPSFHPHRPAALTACLHDVGFESWRADHGWVVAYHAAIAAPIAGAEDREAVVAGAT
jgi:2-polyprenyl-3-methyl-5-hydroxy-6-metoxy-1,4-benzoquinol methylase